jgi:hypothetical protein
MERNGHRVVEGAGLVLAPGASCCWGAEAVNRNSLPLIVRW